jgi:hypothetical protein
MSGLTPPPTKGSTIRPASPPTASRRGRLAIAHSSLRGSCFCLYHACDYPRIAAWSPGVPGTLHSRQCIHQPIAENVLDLLPSVPAPKPKFHLNTEYAAESVQN